MFAGRDLLIATMHGKEHVIAPVLERELGVKCIVAPDLDTDILGTFSGEVERKEDPITTARHKCLMAMEVSQCDLAVASEGSFGPHPSVFFIPADDEILLLMDRRNGIEIISRELSAETNYNGSVISTEEALGAFAEKAKFPSHGLIIKNAKEGFTALEKGITSPEKLYSTFKHFISRYGTAFVETDMRAMHNPTRMKAIEKAANKLVRKINSLCPICTTPGFGITDAKQGLPCRLCNFPTRSTISYIYTCQKCAFTKEEVYPDGTLTEDPMYCDVCNP